MPGSASTAAEHDEDATESANIKELPPSKSEQPSPLHSPPRAEAGAEKGQEEEKIPPAEAQKIAAIQQRIAHTESQLSDIRAQQAALDCQLSTPDPAALVKAHIKMLHDYNAIRDVGQGLLGLIAERRGCRVAELYKEFGLAESD